MNFITCLAFIREDEDEETAAILDPEGKPVREKTEDTTKSSEQSESKENQVGYLSLIFISLSVFFKRNQLRSCHH